MTVSWNLFFNNNFTDSAKLFMFYTSARFNEAEFYQFLPILLNFTVFFNLHNMCSSFQLLQRYKWSNFDSCPNKTKDCVKNHSTNIKDNVRTTEISYCVSFVPQQYLPVIIIITELTPQVSLPNLKFTPPY